MLENSFPDKSFQFMKEGRADGIYMSLSGEPHNFLARGAQRERLLWARPSDTSQAFHIFSANALTPLSLSEYYALIELNKVKPGIPGHSGECN